MEKTFAYLAIKQDEYEIIALVVYSLSKDDYVDFSKRMSAITLDNQSNRLKRYLMHYDKVVIKEEEIKQNLLMWTIASGYGDVKILKIDVNKATQIISNDTVRDKLLAKGHKYLTERTRFNARYFKHRNYKAYQSKII